jgi:hypothetical protein
MTVTDDEVAPPLPDPRALRRTPNYRPVVTAAVIGGGICLLAVIVGLVVLGIKDNADEQISSTGLASIGATLAGGFAAWIGRTTGQQNPPTDDRRVTDKPKD